MGIDSTGVAPVSGMRSCRKMPARSTVTSASASWNGLFTRTFAVWPTSYDFLSGTRSTVDASLMSHPTSVPSPSA